MHKEGDIRLVGGSYSWQGRVEIYLYGEWGTISYPYTIRESAHVVCVQLGYDTRCEYIQDMKLRVQFVLIILHFK